MSDRDTGLAAMVAAAQPGDHGVVADWIEEYLHLDDLATILRAGLDDPRDADERPQTICDEFRYRRLDRFVLLTVAKYHLHQPLISDQVERQGPSGYVVCLCTPPTSPSGMRRWGRWFPTTTLPALTRLWDDLGKDMPEEVE